MEPVGACAGVSDRFDLARCLNAPYDLNGQIKREESALVSGQIYSLSPLFVYSLGKKDMIRSQVHRVINKSACTVQLIKYTSGFMTT